MRKIRSILKPEIYQGYSRKPPYFEGWYYKLISEDESHKYAIIPGIFLGKNGYSFIQILNGNSGKVEFIKFPLEAFKAAKDEFFVKIDRNIFCLNFLQLDIDHKNTKIKGNIEFGNVTGWPVRLTSPGVMGWYAWVPRMECYHGVLGFDHEIFGQLEINGSEFELTKGRGYIEKDWGTAFPEGYIWLQTNHFNQPRTCLTASIAIIPWLNSSFRGFIVGLWIDGELYRFATYTGAKTDDLKVTQDNVIWKMSDKKFKLTIEAEKGKTGDLKGPTRKDMGMRVAESLVANVNVRFEKKNGEVIFEDSGRNAGFEMAGDIEKLLNTD